MFGKMTRKKMIMMIVAIFIVAVTYFIAMGVFKVYSSYGDVLSISKGVIVAEEEGEWSFTLPEKNSLTPYFTFEGEKFPMKTISLRSIFYVKDNEEIKEKYISCELISDKHFFFGESRWYIPEKYGEIVSIYSKLAYREYPYGEMYYDYLYSSDLSQEQINRARAWVDREKMN